MESPEIPQCEKCSVCLGNTTRVIMCTISPDPLIKGYGDMLPHKQCKFINKILSIGLKELMVKYDDGFKFGIHYELNKDRNLHVHMLVALAEEYTDYDIHCAIMSKTFHKLVGRKGNKSMISAHVVWCDKEKYTRYVNKENVYESYHLHSPINLKTFLI